MKKILFFPLVILIVVGLYFISRPSLHVDTMEAFTSPVISTVYATGVVESRMQADLAPLITARILKFNVNEGDKVRNGQVLIEFDDEEARASVDSLKAQLSFQELELRRQTELAAKQFGSEQDKESAQSMVDKLKADLEAAQKRLDEHRLIAPQEGVILKKEGDVGEVIQSGKTLISIGDPQNLRINAEVDEEGLPDLKVGQRTLIKADAYPDQVFEGQVEDITPLGDSVNKNYRVYVGYKNAAQLSISMTVDCNIITQAKDRALLVPSTALREGKLWVIDRGDLKLQPVKIGIRGDRFWEVLEGVQEGDEIVMKYKDEFQQGEAVRASLTEINIEEGDR